MNICHVSSARKAFLAGVLALLVAGCSTMSQVKTWDGEPANANQAATLKTPEEIRVLRVNGRAMTNFLMDNLELDYALLPGPTDIAFTFKTIWGKTSVVRDGESKVDVVESAPQVVRFIAEPGEVYRIAYQKPASKREAEAMMDGFTVSIVNAAGEEVAQSSVWTPESDVAGRTPIPAVGGSVAAGAGDSALDQLKAIWATASEDEKRAFLRWAFE